MKKLDKPVLAEGEVTGHRHILDIEIPVYENEDGSREFKSSVAVKVKHEEHKEIEVPAGEWISDKVIEQDHYADEARKVQD